MSRAASGILAFAFAVTFVQSPWLHVHDSSPESDHYRNEHAGLGVVHGHGHDADGPEWRDPDSDGDAHFLGPVKGVRARQVVVSLIIRSAPVLVQPVLAPVGRPVELAPKAHGPPGLISIPPRAPPA